MRFHFSISFLLLSFILSAQKPFQFKLEADASVKGEVSLKLDGKLQEDWYLYMETDTAAGIEAFGFSIAGASPKEGNYISQGSLFQVNDPIFDNKRETVVKGDFVIEQAFLLNEQVSSLNVELKGYISDGKSFLPVTETKEISLAGNSIASPTINAANPVANCGEQNKTGASIWTIFLLGFGGGLLALLTPCIFPMIPVTVGFFAKKAVTRHEGLKRAFTFGAWILVIYLLASVPFHLAGNVNPQIFNNISTNPWVNIFFFSVFLLFALSFFGLFEIQLPAGLRNSAGARTGTFFMALTLVTVSFSCTGIILGSLLVNAISGGGTAWQLTAGMGGFGLALALPFTIFALFPQWLNRIPKSGGWLHTVKVSLAFIELALAIKFLSNADLVQHWGILKRETFLVIWIILGICLSIYLLGVLQQKFRFLSVRTLLGALTLLFSLYLVRGLVSPDHARLPLISGFPPPISYSIFKSKGHAGIPQANVVNDYEAAVKLAKQEGKPILIDFTGWACINCRKMEEQVWTRPAIQSMITEKFVLVSLYVDDRAKLPGGTTVGEKWAKFQADNFKQVTQPLYVILSPEEQLLNHPVGYTPGEETYKAWLECGLDAFKTKMLATQ